MSRILWTLALAGTLSAAAPARAADGPEPAWRLDAALPVALIAGHTTYRISSTYANGSVASELVFPLQGLLAGLQGRLSLGAGDDGGRWVFEGSARHSLTEATGTMEDSDWFEGQLEVDAVGATHPGKDIYSRSKASLQALVLEARAAREYALTPALRVAPLAGVLYQSFEYSVRDVRQVGYGPWEPGFTGDVSGRALTYEVAYRAIYVGARGELSLGEGISGVLDAWFSPFAQARDRDDHLLRGKLSETEADGRAGQVSLEGRIALGPEDALVLQGSLVAFSARGKQTFRFYAGPSAGATGEVDARLTSLRYTAGAAWTHRL